ncbi:hypothetical protein L1D32_08150 [Shewanella insulae]|uniref:hypothetical protein n=1 Tax=Shewanella insulae TaxID=2681496 RepID=UPI001EFD9DBE|nr:hypothetical protein [Shewanella insulae]MCG9738125.1 hypothetical protein [Shewanella insulae]MCG9754841.1 hypothetical protein [Shewanella insulae]
MKLLKGTPLLLSGIVLTACGGGSDETDNNQNSTTPAAHIVGEFKTTATQCGYSVANTDVTLVVHKADGSVLSQHQVDDQGKFDILWPNEAKHLTTVWQDNGNYNIDTSLNLNVSDMGIQGFYSDALNENCTCQDVSIDYSDIGAAYPNHQLQINNAIKDTSTPDNYHLCRAPQETFKPFDLLLLPTNDADEQAYGALIETPNEQSVITISADMFSEEENQAKKVNYSNANLDATAIYAFGSNDNGRTHFQYQQLDYYNLQPDLYVLPKLNPKNFIQAYRDVQLRNDPESLVWYYGGRRHLVNDPDENQEIVLPENEFELLQTMTDIAANSNSALNYDFTNLNTEYQALQLRIVSTNLDWTIFADLSGVIPDLKLPTAMEENLSTQVESVNLTLFGYFHAKGMNNIREAWAKESRSDSKIRPDYFDNYVVESISTEIR